MKKMKSIKFMAIVVVSLFISSYSYGTGPCLLGVGEGCDPSTQSTTTPAAAHGYDVTGGSSRMTSKSMCATLEKDWKNKKLKIASIKSTAKEKIKKLKKHILAKYNKRDYKARYIRERLPVVKKHRKTKAWRQNDYRKRWYKYKDGRKRLYYKRREAIIKSAKSKIMVHKKEKIVIKNEYNVKYNCKSKKSRYR